MSSTYTFTFFDAVGQEVESEPVECMGDVRAVVSAIQDLQTRPDCEAVQVARGPRLIRRIERAEIG